MTVQRWLRGSACPEIITWFIFSLVCIGLPVVGEAAESGSPSQEFRVGIRDIKPFIFLEGKAEPQGYSIDLWRAIADQHGISYRFVPLAGIAATLEAMENGELDIAIGAITITKEREKKFDFSYSHYHTGLGILTQIKEGYSFGAFLSSFFTTTRVHRLATFLLFLVVSAHIIWLVERRYSNSFHRKYFPGVFEGIYWSVVTASTVGYGDYAPKSKTGKALAVLLIFISLPLFAVFIANISSNITLHELRSVISGPQDLVGKRVGVVSGSTSEGFFARNGLIPAITAPKADTLYKLVEAGELDAVVQDLPSLQYYAANGGRNKVQIVGTMFDKQDYAFLLPNDSTFKEKVDLALLQLMENGTEAVIRNRWFGAEQPDQGK